MEELELGNKKLDLSYFVNTESSELSLGLPDGLRIAIKCWGNERAKTRILALHGWLDNVDSFARLAPLLTSSRMHDIRIVAMDFAGHGKSSHSPLTSNYSVQERVFEVVSVADALNWGTFILMAHSMGAGIATIIAGTIPTRIEKLILLDGLGPWPARDTAPERMEALLKLRPKLMNRQRKVYPSVQAAVERYMSNTKISKIGAELLVRRSTQEVIVGGETDSNGTERTERGIVFTHDARMTAGPGPNAMPEESVREFLMRISCPVLLIAASSTWNQSKKGARNFMEERMKIVKNFQLVIADGDHHVHLDNPELIYSSILAFLSGQLKAKL